jgi:RNA polymerase-binding transcription factor DksA
MPSQHPNSLVGQGGKCNAKGNVSLTSKRFFSHNSASTPNTSATIRRQGLELSDDGVKDSSDLSVMDLNQELAFRLGDRESQMVADIDQALLRIKEGLMASALAAGNLSTSARLEAVPTARYDADCQALLEQPAAPVNLHSRGSRQSIRQLAHFVGQWSLGLGLGLFFFGLGLSTMWQC